MCVGGVFFPLLLKRLCGWCKQRDKKKEDTNLSITGFLTLRKKVHRFYEIRWHRGIIIVLIHTFLRF